MEALKYLVWLIRAVYTTIVVLMATWIGKHTGGLEWYPLAGFFNYHPLMMVRGGGSGRGATRESRILVDCVAVAARAHRARRRWPSPSSCVKQSWPSR